MELVFLLVILSSTGNGITKAYKIGDFRSNLKDFKTKSSQNTKSFLNRIYFGRKNVESYEVDTARHINTQQRSDQGKKSIMTKMHSGLEKMEKITLQSVKNNQNGRRSDFGSKNLGVRPNNLLVNNGNYKYLASKPSSNVTIPKKNKQKTFETNKEESLEETIETWIQQMSLYFLGYTNEKDIKLPDNFTEGYIYDGNWRLIGHQLALAIIENIIFTYILVRGVRIRPKPWARELGNKLHRLKLKSHVRTTITKRDVSGDMMIVQRINDFLLKLLRAEECFEETICRILPNNLRYVQIFLISLDTY